jgi:DNA invertase Pin-like site-specific DNA recombinase
VGDNQAVAAAIYCRISLAVLKDTTKVDDQARQCREVAERNGWKVAEVYTDNSKSAWKRNRKRPGWDAMLAAAADGRFGAIISYWGDRIVRQPRDLEDLLDLYETRDIKIASIMGQYDIRNKDHRMMMRWEVARACNESDTISQRKKNGLARLRADGRTRPGGPGGRCFGFESDGMTQRKSEAGHIRWAASNLLFGESLGSLAAELAAQGVTTTAGKPMTVKALSRILSYPRMAALMPDGVSPAAWEPVLPREQWESVQVLLGANRPLPNAGKGAQHLLSGIARCGLCGHQLWSGRNAGGPAYRCAACARVGRSMTLLDAYVSGAVTGRLSKKENPRGSVPEAPGLALEFAALTQAHAEAEAAIADPAHGSRLPILLKRLDLIEKRLDELRGVAGDDARRRLIATHAGITDDEFDGLPLQVRRSLVAACFEVTVLPASRRGPGFRPEDVRLIAR